MRKFGLAAIAAVCLWTGSAVPVLAQQTIMVPWKIERYDNGYMFYYCNGSTLWTNVNEQPGTFIEVTAQDPSAC